MKRAPSAATIDLDSKPLSEVCRDVYAEMRRSNGKPTGRRIADVFSEADKAAQFRQEVRGRPAVDPVVEAPQALTALDDDPYAQIRVQEGSGELTADAHARDHARTQEPANAAPKRPKRVCARAGR